MAERSGKPAGLLIDVGAGDAAGVLALAEIEACRGLSSEFACFYRPLVDEFARMQRDGERLMVGRTSTPSLF